jgi:hypothetical protein
MNLSLEKLKEARDAGIPDDVIWEAAASAEPKFNELKNNNIPLDVAFEAFQGFKPVGTSFTDKLQTATEELEMTIADIPLALGEAFSGLTKTAPASFYAAKEGLARPDQYSKEALAAFDTQREYFKQLEQQAKTREAEGKSTAVGEAIRGAGQSLGFTVAGMAPAIAGGAITGAAASALFPPAASATIPIGAIAGGIGSMVASAPVSYRMAGGQFLYDAFKSLEESKGSPLTEEEKTKAYNELLPIAQNTALWEAGPEAIGNAVQLGALKYAFGFGKKAATNVAGQAIQKANDTLLKKVGAVAGGQVVELAGETITQTQQGADQAKMEQYVKTGSTAGAPDEYQGLAGAVKAFKEVAPTTLALGAITAGAGGAVKVVGMGGKQVGKVLFSKPKTPEQIAEDQINDAANRVANDLSISPDDTQANNLNQQIKALSEVQEIRKQTLAAIEPTSREAQTLKLDIAEGESMLGELNQNLTKLTGLSEPITEAERQQAELAKAIVEEPAPTVKESLTVQPAQAAPAPVEQVVTPPVEDVKKPNIEIKEVENGFQVLVDGTPQSDTIWATREAASQVAKSEYEYEMRKAKKKAPRAISEMIISTSPDGDVIYEPKISGEIGDIISIKGAISASKEDGEFPARETPKDYYKQGDVYRHIDDPRFKVSDTNEEGIVKLAEQATEKLTNKDNSAAINGIEQHMGAFSNPQAATKALNQYSEVLKPIQEAHRSLLRQKYGDTVTVYRAVDPNFTPSPNRNVSSWTLSKENVDKLYFGLKDRVTLTKTVKVDDIQFMHNWREAEVLLRDDAKDIAEPAPVEPITPAPVTEQAAPAEAPAPEVAKPTGGVDYYKQLGEQDALDTNRKKKRSVPQNFKLAYENGWSAAKRKAREEAPTPAVSETITEPKLGEKGGVLIPTKEDVRYNPLGYDIADVVEDIKQGKTSTPLKAVNQVIKESTDLRKRVAAESTRRQQPRKMGKAAILERIARERSAGNINENTAKALTDFINRVNDDAIWDTAISIRAKGVSNYDFADNLVTFFLNQDKGDFGASVGIHEFWHGLSRFLPDAEVEKINNDYTKELADYLKKNPWFLAFVGRYSLTPEQFEAYKKFNPKEAETKLIPVKDEQGNIVKYKIKFDKDNYRYIMLDEFIAEKMTDLVLGKQQEPNTFLGKLAKVLREFMALIKARLGVDPYEKFYQAVTSTNGKLVLQRQSGVATAMQIYDPVEYDYSTRKMAVEPEQGDAPIKPEAKTITEGLVQGIDIGKETNMPINNKIESHIKNFAFVRGIFESASDRLRRAKFTKLATAIDDYYDQAQRRLGFANKILLPAFEEYSKQSKATKAKIDEEVKMFFAAQENKRDTAEFFDDLNPITQKIVTAWQKFGEESGKENQRIGIKVYDKGLQRWRPIGRVDKFWPRVLKPEYKRALMEPDKYQKEYNEIVEALMKSGRIENPEEAEVFISEYEGTGSKNDYFSGIETARGQAFPEELYDYSMQVMTDYAARWAQHSSRIEQFGQKLGENSMTLWDKSRASTRDRRTIDYITAAQERVEGYYPNDPIVKGMATLNIWSTGPQLGNPASSMLNFFGGTTLNAMVGQPGAFSSYLSSFVELRKLGKELKDAREKGIVSRDLMNIVGDHQAVLEYNRIAQAGQKTTDFLLKWSGFTPVEQMVRTQSMIIGKSFLRKTLSSLSKNPNSSFSKRALTWLNRNNIDADKLIVEKGSGPETDKLLRYFANISQGSYTIAQTPIFIDTPIGRFLFKYQKFSTQVMRQSWKNTFEPAWKAVTNKNETLQLPDPTRQLLYRLRLAEAKELGDNRKITLDEIPKKVTKAEGKALTIIPVMMWLGAAYVGGEVILRMRDMLFGVLMKGPSYEDIIRAFEDDEDDDELYLALERAWYNLIGMGALGLIGNYAQFFMDWQDRERVKNPLDPPALSIFKETATFIQNAVDQGTITAGDINNYLNRTLSGYRVLQRAYQTTASWLGYSKAPTVAEEMFRREAAVINKYARRWAESAGLEYRTKRPMDIAPSKMTPINREIASYLQRGEPGAAVAYAKEYLNSLPKKERENAIQSMESGARFRQPFRLGNGPMDKSEKEAFTKWLKEKVSKEDFDKFQKLDKDYKKSYNMFLNGLPNK